MNFDSLSATELFQLEWKIKTEILSRFWWIFIVIAAVFCLSFFFVHLKAKRK